MIEKFGGQIAAYRGRHLVGFGNAFLLSGVQSREDGSILAAGHLFWLNGKSASEPKGILFDYTRDAAQACSFGNSLISGAFAFDGVVDWAEAQVAIQWFERFREDPIALSLGRYDFTEFPITKIYLMWMRRIGVDSWQRVEREALLQPIRELLRDVMKCRHIGVTEL